MQTEFEFTLPRGYIDAQGQLHRHGRMRLATALDEIEPLRDPRVQSNDAYLSVVLLARVITRLGNLTHVTPDITAHLFAADIAYLEELYQRINVPSPVVLQVACPHCAGQFQIQVAPIE